MDIEWMLRLSEFGGVVIGHATTLFVPCLLLRGFPPVQLLFNHCSGGTVCDTSGETQRLIFLYPSMLNFEDVEERDGGRGPEISSIVLII
jgi:hypothetical protein